MCNFFLKLQSSNFWSLRILGFKIINHCISYILITEKEVTIKMWSDLLLHSEFSTIKYGIATKVFIVINIINS